MIKSNKSKGFTLIELLVALAIVGTILLAFFKVIDSTNRMNAKNDRDIKALNIAQSEIENLRNQIKNYEQTEELYVKDNESKNISIAVKEDENCNITYKKDMDGKEFEIYLDISKSEVKPQNGKIDIGMYLYTINIKVKSLDKYFSTKETEIKDVKILSKHKS